MINPLFKKWIEPYRYKVAYGGRGSSKSWSVAELLIEISRRAKVRILCTRELQVSISDSVIQLLSDTIDRCGAADEFDIQRTTIIHRRTGSTFLFYGLKTNTSKIKSLEGVDICWCEEAENISDDSWNILIPTIRKPGSEIWITFNPGNILDPTYQNFVVTPPKNSLVMQVNYIDNPFFTDVLREEMEAMKDRDHELYLHIWEGQPTADSEHAFIKPVWIKTAIDAHKHIEAFKNNSGRKVIGFDVADEGEDFNAETYAHGSIVHWSKEFSGKGSDVTETTQQVWNEAIIHGADVVYDVIGVGSGAKGESNRLNRLSHVKILFEPFAAGGGVADPDDEAIPGTGRTNKEFFANIKAQAWWRLRQRFENTYHAIVKGREYPIDQLISLSSDNPLLMKLQAELSRPQIKYDDNGRVKVESKKELAKRGIASPNLADSLIQCYIPSNQLYSRDIF